MGYVAPDPQLATVTVAVVEASDAAPAPVAEPRDRRVAIVTLPVAARPATTNTIGAMVAAAVSETLARPADDAAPAEGSDGAAPAALDAAVIAAHEARIAVLRERVATLSAAAAPAAVIGALRVRLHRAESARDLALARAEGVPPDTGRPRDRVLVDRGSLPVRQGTMRPVARDAIATATPSRHDTTHAERRFAVARWSGHAARSLATQPRTLVVAAHRPGHGGIDPITTRRLAAARRSLAAARRLLAEHRAPHAMVLTGLWRWEGSASWTLSADRSPRRDA